MLSRLSTWIPLILALLTVAGCGGGGGSGAGPQHDLYVDASSGDDNNSGTQAAPLKTISEALARALGGESIKVAPGLYDVANGEVFPLVVPAGVRLIGDPDARGKGAVATGIVGANTPGLNNPGRAVELGLGSEISGFMLQNPPPHASTHPAAEVTVLVREDGAVVRRCTIENNSVVGIHVTEGATGGSIVENDVSFLTGNHAVAVFFNAGGSAFRVEGNRLRNNRAGVAVLDAVPDLGGGIAGSAGNNTIAQNSDYDLAVVDVSISARDNRWDHAPPEVHVGTMAPAGIDIKLSDNGINVDTLGAKVELVLTPAPVTPIGPGS